MLVFFYFESGFFFFKRRAAMLTMQERWLVPPRPLVTYLWLLIQLWYHGGSQTGRFVACVIVNFFLCTGGTTMKISGQAILDMQNHVIGIVGEVYRRCTVSTRTHLVVCPFHEGDLGNGSI